MKGELTAHNSYCQEAAIVTAGETKSFKSKTYMLYADPVGNFSRRTFLDIEFCLKEQFTRTGIDLN